MGREMDWPADLGGFPYTLDRCPQAGDAALTTRLAACLRQHHRAGMVLSVRCPWREVRNGVGSQYCCVSILNSASPIRADLSNRLYSPICFTADQRRGREHGCRSKNALRVSRAAFGPLGHNTLPAPAVHKFASPAKGSVETNTCVPFGAAALCRQPRRQRRVARLRPQGTVWTENRPCPRASPFRVPLPWPPRGGLGVGG